MQIVLDDMDREQMQYYEDGQYGTMEANKDGTNTKRVHPSCNRYESTQLQDTGFGAGVIIGCVVGRTVTLQDAATHKKPESLWPVYVDSKMHVDTFSRIHSITGPGLLDTLHSSRRLSTYVQVLCVSKAHHPLC